MFGNKSNEFYTIYKAINHSFELLKNEGDVALIGLQQLTNAEQNYLYAFTHAYTIDHKYLRFDR